MAGTGDLESETGGGHMAASFTDLMASLMVVFVLLFVATVSNAGASRARVQSELLEEFRRRFAANALDTTMIQADTRDPYAILLVLPDSLLFERDSSRVRQAGEEYLGRLAPVMTDAICEDGQEERVDYVIVEGHTDTTFASARRTADDGRDYNLRLSQARSMAVVTTALKALGERDTVARACFRRKVSASGRGQEEPVEGIAGDDAKQRRVVFKIRARADLASQLLGKMRSEDAAAELDR